MSHVEKGRLSLSDGQTAFQRSRGGIASLEGKQEDARDLLLVFGGFHFPRNCDAFWSRLAEDLTETWEILWFDSWGRGGSEAPDLRYDAGLYTRQGAEILEALGYNERTIRIHALGYSFGGAVATHFCAAYPEKIHSLILSGAWGLWEAFPALVRGMAFLRMTGLLSRVYWKALPGALAKGFDHPQRTAGAAILQEMLATEGAIREEEPQKLERALFSTFRDFPRDTKKTFLSIARHPRPLLLAWGKTDAIAPFRYAEAMKKAAPHADLVALEGNHNDLWRVEALAAPLRQTLASFLVLQGS